MRRGVLSAAIGAAAALISVPLVAPATSAAATPVIYNSTEPLPAGGTSFPSEGFQCCQIDQLGDAVGFVPGTNRVLTQVTVTMDDWAIYEDPLEPSSEWKNRPTEGNLPALNGPSYTNPNGFYIPVTLNLYNISAATGPRWTTGSLIKSVTQDVLIPWRPSPNFLCELEGHGQDWRNSEEHCYSGYAANITISLGSGVVVPNQLAWGLAFNTTTWGAAPTGKPGPYESLNMALTPSVTTGTDINPGAVFLEGESYPYSTAGAYNVFRNDCLPGPDGGLESDNSSGCEYWSGYIPAAQFAAKAVPTVKSTPSGTIPVGGSETDGVKVTGNAAGGAPTEKVNFFLCAKGTSPCATGGSAVGSSVSLTASSGTEASATSSSATPSEPGTYCFRAVYEGNEDYTAEEDASSGECFTATKATPTIMTSQQPASATVGSSIADKATVSAGYNPTGTVTFNLYNNPNGTGTPLFTDTESLVAGAATSAGYTTTATGTDYWVATYNGDSNNNAVTSGTALEPVVVSPATPVISTTQQPASAIVGSSIADKATVSGGFNPTGAVTFNLYSNSTATGTPLFTDTENLVGGAATSAGYTATATATDYWVATYNGNSNNNTVTSGTALEPVTISKANTSTAVMSSLNPSVFGQSVTFTATLSVVAPGSGTPTGHVEFLANGNPISACGGVSGESLSGGVATCTTSALAVGNDAITTTYSGDSNFNGSTGTLSGGQTVLKANTSTTVMSSVNPSVVGQSVTFTAKLSAVAPGSGTPTGHVEFLADGSPISACGGVAGELLSVGSATCTTSALAVGTHTITTSYGGDSNFTGSTGTLSGGQTVSKATPTVKSTPSGEIPVGSSETDAVKVTGNATGGAPSEKVKFFICAKGTSPCTSGGSAVGSPVSLTASSGSEATATSASVIPSEGPGTYCFRAEYEGNADYTTASDASAGECFNFGKAAPLVKSTPSGTIALGATETDAVTVTGNPTGGVPSGHVKFFLCVKGTSPCTGGGSTVGSPGELKAGSGDEASTSSSAVTPSEGPGTYCFRSEYEGNANYTSAADISADGCFTVSKATPIAKSTPVSESGVLPVSDVLAVTGNATGGAPTGKVKFFLCAKGTSPCASGGTAVGAAVELKAGTGAESTATSSSITPSEGTGVYCFRAEYEGSANYLGATDGSTGECFSYPRTTPTVKSTPSGEIAVGGSETDGVAVTGNATGGFPTGNVKFFLCAKATNPCTTGGSTVGSSELKAAVGNESKATSPSTTPGEGPGTYCLRSEYEGNASYNSAADASATECFTLVKATPTAKSTPSGEIAVGATETDAVKLTGNVTGGAPTGKAKFFLCAKGTSPCASGGTAVGTTVELTGTGAEASGTSASVTPAEGPGSYCFRAEYEGNSNYNAASDASATECFTVVKAASTSKSTPSGEIALGASETDSVTVKGNSTGGAPSGKAKFFLCAKGTSPCATGGSAVGASVELKAGTGAEASAISQGVTPNEGPGSYCFRAEYEGSTTYNASTDASATECFTVAKATPTVKSTPSGQIAEGASETDAVTVTGNATGAAPTGKAKFLICAKGTSPCATGGSAVGAAVELKAGTGTESTATSASVTPSEGAGTYCFRSEYENSTNYNAASDASASECFTVTAVTTTTTTTTTTTKSTPAVKSKPSGTIPVGGTETDTAAVTGNASAGVPTGKVSFLICPKNTNPCATGGTAVGSPVELKAGTGDEASASSSNVTPSEGAGTYCFRSEYEGNSSYNASSDASAGECFTVSAPGFSIEKEQKLEGEASYTKGKLSAKAAQNVDYLITVKNTGTTELTLSALTDAKCENIAPSGQVKLEAGKSQTYTCEHKGLVLGAYANVASIQAGSETKESNTVEVEASQTIEEEPISEVKGVCTLSEGKIKLRGVHGKHTKPFKARISSLGIKTITFYVDGKKLKTLKHSKAKHGKFRVKINPVKYSYGRHKVSVTTVMSNSNCAAISRSKHFVRPKPGPALPH